MNCAPRNNNPFGPLEALNLPPPNELSQSLSHHSTAGKGPFRESAGVAGKTHRSVNQQCDPQRQCNPIPRQNGHNRPRPTESRGRNNVVHRDNGFNRCPPQVPPRPQNPPVEHVVVPPRFCNPPPIPFCNLEGPCRAATSACPENHDINLLLKQQILFALQGQPPATCPDTPMSMLHPICIPTPPSLPNPTKVPQDNIVPSTTAQRAATPKQPPQKPEVISRTPTNATDPINPSETVNVNLVPPPGLPRTNDRRMGRTRAAEQDKILPSKTTQPTASPKQPPQKPEVISHTPTNAIEPSKTADVSSPPPGPPRPNGRKMGRTRPAKPDNTLSSATTQRAATPKQPPQKPEAVSRTPTNTTEPSKVVDVSVPPPPGLPRPNGRRTDRSRPAEQEKTLPSMTTQRAATPKQPPQKPEVVSRTPTNATEPSKAVEGSVPPPPGLPRPNGRRMDSSRPAEQDSSLPSTASQRSATPKQPQKPEVVSRTPTNATEPSKAVEGNVPPPPGLPRPNGRRTDNIRPAEQDSISPSTMAQPAANPEQSQKPEVISRTPTDAIDLIDLSETAHVSLPPPPGLPRPNDRRMGRDRAIKPANAERLPNKVVDDSSFERFNGPVAASRVISPPPPGAISNAVKLPPSKVAQPRPSSPSTTASSLSEDLFGTSSVLRSDTTFTSVESYTSDKAPQRPRMSGEICRRWTRGHPCFITPCRFLHPGAPDQPENPAKQPARTFSAPQSLSDTVNAPAHVGGQKNGLIPQPQKQNPPSSNAEPPQRPEQLYVTTIADHIKVRFDQGFEVRDVVTGFESRWVHLGNIASSVTSAALNKLLGPYNVEVTNLPETSLGKPITVKVQFASPADAIKAVADLHGVEFAGRIISAKSAINNSIGGGTVLKDTDVQVVWECPSRVGYAGYDTLKEATAAIDSLNGSAFENVVVTAQLYEGIPCIGAYNVIFKQVPASVTEQGLRKFANTQSVMLGRPNYQSLDKAIDSIRSRLEEYGTVTSFDILPPPFRDGLVKAWAHFTSPSEARAAQDDFDHRRPKAVGHTTISCRHILSVSHTLNAVSYRKMRSDIGWLRESWYHRFGPGITLREKVKENADDDAPAHIRISCDDSLLLSHLKYEFEQLLQGDTLMLEKKPLWDDFLVVEAGRIFIAQVQAQHPGIQVQIQKNRRVVSLWGPITMRHRARQQIVQKISELKAQQFWKIPLSGRLLGIFFSAELSTLQELLGPDNCILDFGERVLVVRGNDAAYRTACSAVQAAQNRQDEEVRTSDAAICPVCFGEVIVPVSLACGHQWCRACLVGYLTSAVENKMFPLRCLGNDATCTQCIPLGLSRKLLSTTDFNAVLEAAFWVYIHSRPDEFYHCPMPDCTQVYRSAPPNAVLQCPSCLVRICPACRIEHHDGMTCEERDVADDKLFKEWRANHNVKGCPGCKAPIERTEGCNHVTCTRCQTHICWECLATFPKGQGIYDHMRIQHGGIGL